jgi:hypothetical protein
MPAFAVQLKRETFFWCLVSETVRTLFLSNIALGLCF